jgi:hypothetical protein
MLFKKRPVIPLTWTIWLGVVALVVMGILLSQPSAPIHDPAQDILNQTQWELREEHYAAMVLDTGFGVLVSDQLPGSGVNIAKATMEVSGFIAIFNDEDGAPGKSIGSVALEKGEHTDIVITLDRKLQAGEVCYAVVMKEKDTAMTDADGTWILMSFQVLEE